MIINYGTKDCQINITDVCYNKLCRNNIIRIPSNDVNRAMHFSDPIYGILKSIFISFDSEKPIEYDDTKDIFIDIATNVVTCKTENDYIETLKTMHQNLKIEHGSFNEEYPEQLMVVKYLTGNEKVLEIGGNIGRNSLIIAQILHQKQRQNNFVTLESSAEISRQLSHNRDINYFNFHIETSALSKRPLIQRGWDTIVSEQLLDGYQPVQIISLDELNAKYNIEFDTLVLDCEGAFYYILMDMPEILDNINLIIMENDYWDIEKKHFIDNILIKQGFYVDYSRAGGWGPCMNNFFEVWKK
jgi:FkbM family methyltransferase